MIDREKVREILRSPGKKKLQYLLVGVLLAAILLIYLSTFRTAESPKKAAQEPSAQTQAQGDLAEKLERILSKVAGAGRVDVVINYESSAELVPAMSEQNKSSTNESEGGSSSTQNESRDIATVKEGSDTSAFIIKEIQPVVRGVLVVAEGAGDISVRVKLLEAVQTFLAIDGDKVEVLKMEHTGK